MAAGAYLLTFAKRQGPPPNVPPPDDHHVLLVEALKQIPAAQRRVIVLHHLCDLEVKQVAEETNSPVGTVKAQLSRGRAALAKILADTQLDPRAVRVSEVERA